MLFNSYTPPPFLFNPIKHHLGFIRTYINSNSGYENQLSRPVITRELKHLGTSLMDIYKGELSLEKINKEICAFLTSKNLYNIENFCSWTGKKSKDFKTISLSDDSEWVIKYFDDKLRYIHYFPARNSPHSLRAKANTLKSAVLYLIFIDKDFITEVDLNRSRATTGLSPVKDVYEAEAITELIEIIRSG